MNYNADGTGIGFGKVSEKSNAIEFELDTYFYNKLILKSSNEGSSKLFVITVNDDGLISAIELK